MNYAVISRKKIVFIEIKTENAGSGSFPRIRVRELRLSDQLPTETAVAEAGTKQQMQKNVCIQVAGYGRWWVYPANRVYAYENKVTMKI